MHDKVIAEKREQCKAFVCACIWGKCVSVSLHTIILFPTYHYWNCQSSIRYHRLTTLDVVPYMFNRWHHWRICARDTWRITAAVHVCTTHWSGTRGPKRCTWTRWPVNAPAPSHGTSRLWSRLRTGSEWTWTSSPTLSDRRNWWSARSGSSGRRCPTGFSMSLAARRRSPTTLNDCCRSSGSRRCSSRSWSDSRAANWRRRPSVGLCFSRCSAPPTASGRSVPRKPASRSASATTSYTCHVTTPTSLWTASACRIHCGSVFRWEARVKIILFEVELVCWLQPSNTSLTFSVSYHCGTVHPL